MLFRNYLLRTVLIFSTTLRCSFKVELFKGTGRYALWATIVTLPAALVLIGLDLGRWDRFWKVYLEPNFTSLLAQLVWSYTIFWIVAIVAMILAVRKSDMWLRSVMVIGLVLSLFVSGGVGALLGVLAVLSSVILWRLGDTL